jgi:hypothetical protein
MADCFGRAIPIGATEKDCRAILVGAADPFCRAMFSHSPERAAFRLQWREGTVLSCHPEWRDKHRIRPPNYLGALPCCSLLLLLASAAARRCLLLLLLHACFCCLLLLLLNAILAAWNSL